MRTISTILVLSTVIVCAQSQGIPNETSRVIEDEAWVLQLKEPTREERIREHNTRWMLETSARHWSREGKMSSDELDKLRSIYRDQSGKQKVDAFSIITFVEKIENWEGDLVQMLYSNERSYVQSALNVLSAKMQKGNDHERNMLTKNSAIASRIEHLKSLWTDDPNIQNKVQLFKLRLENFRLSEETKVLVSEILPNPLASAMTEVVEESTPPDPTIEEPAEVAPLEVAQETPEQSSQWWLWLIGLLVVFGGLGLTFRRKG